MVIATDYVLSLSYGKDSLACLGAIEQLGWPLNRIVHVEVMATESIPADLPPMVEFKVKANEIIKERYGIEVETLKADTNFNQTFYRKFETGIRAGLIYGWPYRNGNWCQSRLKASALSKFKGTNSISYIGISSDEPNRFHNLNDRVRSPLVEVGWTGVKCREWCEQNELLSPIYTNSLRGGCWFCHNQGVEELRKLRKNYPDYWALMLKWDKDSPVSFKANGHSVHEYDERFQIEDEGFIYPDECFHWYMLKSGGVNYRLF